MLILHETKIIKQEQPQKDYNQPKIKLKKNIKHNKINKQIK